MIFNQRSSLVVAIDLSSRGFGYAVFDGPTELVDWGTHQITGDRDVNAALKIKQLLDWYEPQQLVLEDCDAPGALKRTRVRVLSKFLTRSAEALGLEVVRVAWTAVRDVCGKSPKTNKWTIASAMAALFPGLQQHLPKRRQWTGEDARMDMFDAAALGVTAAILENRRRATAA